MEASGQLHAPVPVRYEVGWAPDPVWALWRKEKSRASTENLTPVVQPIV
jgi:hypothetical protein